MPISFLIFIIVIFHIFLAFGCISHILLHKRDPRSALGWIVLSSLVLILGPFMYWVFGFNRVQRRARRLLEKGASPHLMNSEEICLTPPVVPSIEQEAESKRFIQVSSRVCQFPLTSGNHIQILFNGDQAYPEMLRAIETAKQSIYLMTYIFDNDKTGAAFVDALCQADRRGVEVKVLIDGIGELGQFKRVSTILKSKGIQVERFLPLSLRHPKLYWNLRNHRKLLLVDNAIAFTGGLNLSSRHLLNDNKSNARVEDIHFKLSGPIISEMDSVFKDDWEFVTGQRLEISDTRYMCDGHTLCRVIVDEPSERIDRLAMTLLGVVSASVKRIIIMTPYFLPSPEMVSALQSASLRGVEIIILLPSKNDNILVHWATRNLLWQFLQFNIQVYYQPPPFVHSKLFIVDDELVFFGSANMDPRSLRLNFEMNVEAYDPILVDNLLEYVSNKVKQSQSYTMQDNEDRSLAAKYRDAIAWLCSPYL